MLDDLQSFARSGSPAYGAEGAWFWCPEWGAQDKTVLSEAEEARVACLVSAVKRDQLRAGLAGRRRLLSNLLGEAPGELRIGHDHAGKPCLPDFPGVSISFSDSEGWNALALSRSGPVGVDIEYIRPIGWEPMLSMISRGDEALTIRNAMAECAGTEAFFRCWTAKEAILKAAGTGLQGGAPSVSLPADFILGRASQFRIEYGGIDLTTETIRADQLILSRALAV